MLVLVGVGLAARGRPRTGGMTSIRHGARAKLSVRFDSIVWHYTDSNALKGILENQPLTPGS